jgi:polyhydroxybutyrate depolymerase
MKKRLTRLALLGLPAGLLLSAVLTFLLANRTNGRLVSGGKKRSYLLYVPKTYNPAVPSPLVISLHGYAEWPARQVQISRWNELAEQHGFLVVYPCGTGFPLRWRMRSARRSAGDPLPDVTFIAELIDRLESEYNVDPARIYANGLSNGGGMSFVLASRLSRRIAAFGSVSGAYLIPWRDHHPSRQVPAILFHGTADPIVPFEGGPSRAFNRPFPAIPDWVETLARHNGCGAAPAEMEMPLRGGVSGVRYSGGPSSAEVVFYTIAGGGHNWPGARPLPEWLVGSTCQDIDATSSMWDFFERHPLAATPQS